MFFESDKEARRFFIVAFIPLVVFLVIIIFRYRLEDTEEYFNKYILPQKYHSEIRQKFIDNKNRGARIIYLHTSDDDSIISANDWVGLWEYVEVGDSILKNEGNYTITLRKKMIRYLISILISRNQDLELPVDNSITNKKRI